MNDLIQFPRASRHEARITESDHGFYALVVRIDADGQENVLHGYKGRHLKTRAAAVKSTDNYIASI